MNFVVVYIGLASFPSLRFLGCLMFNPPPIPLNMIPLTFPGLGRGQGNEDLARKCRERRRFFELLST